MYACMRVCVYACGCPQSGCALRVGVPSESLRSQGGYNLRDRHFKTPLIPVTIVCLSVSVGHAVRCIQVYRYDDITNSKLCDYDIMSTKGHRDT